MGQTLCVIFFLHYKTIMITFIFSAQSPSGGTCDRGAAGRDEIKTPLTQLLYKNHHIKIQGKCTQ